MRFFTEKCTKCVFGRGSAPNPAGNLQRFLIFPAGVRGILLREREMESTSKGMGGGRKGGGEGNDSVEQWRYTKICSVISCTKHRPFGMQQRWKMNWNQTKHAKIEPHLWVKPNCTKRAQNVDQSKQNKTEYGLWWWAQFSMLVTRQWLDARCITHHTVKEKWPENYDKTTGAALLENTEASAKITIANGGTFTWAQLDSVANHVTACSIGDWCALMWLAVATGWTRRERSAICSGKLISVHMIWYDVYMRYGI